MIAGEKLNQVLARAIGDHVQSVRHYRAPGRIKRTYAILMTPRSGSTWLTKEIAARDVLGCPEEFFIVDNLPESLKHNRATNIIDFYDNVSGAVSTAEGLFGFELSYFDLSELETQMPLLDLMRGENFFIYLTRRNLVLQAISLWAAVETNVFHDTGEDATLKDRARVDPGYDEAKIAAWVCHIVEQEYGFTQWQSKYQQHMLRIHYEDLVTDIEAVIRTIGRHVGVDAIPPRPGSSATTHRVERPFSDGYEKRFRAERPGFCAFWESNRGFLSTKPAHVQAMMRTIR